MIKQRRSAKKKLYKQKKQSTINEASLYIALGRVYYFLNQIDKVITYNNECLKIAEEQQYIELLKKCNHNLGVIAFENKQDHELAEKYFLKAIKYGKLLPETKEINLGKNYRLLATTYNLQGRYRLSDSVFNITTSIFKKFNDSLGISEALTFHARLFMSQKKYDKALLLSNESIKIARLLNNDDYLQTALSMYEQINQEMENYKEAYNTKNEIFQMQLKKNSLTQQKEIAESEARFKVAEFQVKEELSELKAKQSKQIYLYTFIILFILGLAAVVFIYQKKSAKKEANFKLESLKNIYEAEEKERIRIAKDLHDNMGAYATSILAQIDVIELSENSLKSEKVTELRNDAENIMSTLRETIWILKNKNISTKQFFDLVRMYADKHLVKNLNLKVRYEENIVTEKILSPAISLNLYRIVQESIQNIIKHSNANEIIFKVTSYNLLQIEILDNGKGFDMAILSRKSGLDNIIHRANEIRFNIHINSQINNGTQINITEAVNTPL